MARQQGDFSDLPTQLTRQRDDLEELRLEVRDVASRSGGSADTNAGSQQAQAFEQLRNELKVLSGRERELASRLDEQVVQADVMVSLKTRLEEGAGSMAQVAEGCAEALAEIRGEVDRLAAQQGDLSGIPDLLAQQREDLEAVRVELRDRPVGVEGHADAPLADSGQIQEDAREEKVMVALWRLEHEVQEAKTRTTGLVDLCSESSTQLQEHEVRLSLVHSKFDITEARFQGCVDRIERLPTMEQVRTTCREEVRKELAMADVQGTARSVSEGIVEDVREQLEALNDQLRFRCTPTSARGGPADKT